MATLRARTLSLEETRSLNRARESRFLRACGFGHLVTFPRFYSEAALVGPDLRQALVTLWTAYIVLEALLMGIAIMAYLATGLILGGGWQWQVSTYLWTMVLILDGMSLVATNMFLYYLYVLPPVLTFTFICHIGGWARLPSALAILVTFFSLATIAYTSWMLFGRLVGISCVVAEIFGVVVTLAAACRLARAAHEVSTLHLSVPEEGVESGAGSGT